MGNESEQKVPAFTLRLSKEYAEKLTKIAQAYGQSKTWAIELLIESFDASEERLTKVKERAAKMKSDLRKLS